MSRFWSLACLCLLALVLTGAQRKVQPVAVVVEYGPFLPSHSTARLRVTIDPHKDNRLIWAAIESDDHADASYRELSGASAPKTWWFDFKDVPDGQYTAYAHLSREHDAVRSASATFTVGAIEAEPFP